jgi:adenine phosphoribosyltransferase
MDEYVLRIAGLERRLPLVEVAPGLRIASFVMLGDTALVEAVAHELSRRPEVAQARLDFLVCPEAKAIALTHALARLLGLDYVVARKSVKAYMRDAVCVESSSITTAGRQLLALEGRDAAKLRGRRVGLIDDVVSTGASLSALERLLSGLDCEIALRAAALLEADPALEAPGPARSLVFLERLPLFREGGRPEERA